MRKLRDNKIELLRTGEIADTGMCDIRRLVSRDDVVPYAHLSPSTPMTLFLSPLSAWDCECSRARNEKVVSPYLVLWSLVNAEASNYSVAVAVW